MMEIRKLVETAGLIVAENEIVALLFIALLSALGLRLALQLTTWGLHTYRRARKGKYSKPLPSDWDWQQGVEVIRAWIEGLVSPQSEERNILRSPTREYDIVGQLGSGDLCEVSYAQSDSGSYVLKYPRVSTCNYLLQKEHQLLHHLHQQCRDELNGSYLPSPSELFHFGPRLVSASAFRAGFVPVSEILQCHPHGVDGRHLAWMFNRSLEVFGFVHRCGWIHGAVLPPHLLINPESHGLQLIGWTHAERIGTPLKTVPRKFKAWYPPECHRRAIATPATDIFLAAKSMIWLAGGDPLTHQMPNSLPIEIQDFLLRCLTNSPAERPQDAWVLHEAFRDLLETVYGPPQFCHLPTAGNKGESYGYDTLV